MRAVNWTLACLALALALSACGFDGPVPPPGPRPVEIENQSQFSLDELRIHVDPDYRFSKNLLAAPLLPGSRTSTVLEGFFYVTVFRERARGARVIALTSDQPLEVLDAERFDLLVFDESFRWVPIYATPSF